MCRSEASSSSASISDLNSEEPMSPQHTSDKHGARLHHKSSAPSSQHPHRLLRRTSSSVSEVSVHASIGSLASLAVVAFSVYLPGLLAPWAASETYQPAFYSYDPGVSHFDNSPWTYGTDYLLAAAMGALVAAIPVRDGAASATQAWRARGLLACYLVSVLAGGLAHQFYTSLDMRNTAGFRALWTVCVGSVTAASAFMGPIGSEMVRVGHERLLPWIPEGVWWAYGVGATLVCAWGGISFQRPACDIFIAGITQFPSTFYMMAILALGLPRSSIPRWARATGILGFILNAPLLPMYPLLVQYTDWSLASINTLLHAWLLTAWGLQGLTLRRIERALARDAADGARKAS